MSFLKKFFGEEVKHGVNEFTSFLVKFDPETASEAQMEVFKQKFDELSLKVATARNNLQKEQDKYNDLEKAYQQRIKAAEILEKKFNETQDPNVEKSLNELLNKLEELKPDVDSEKQDCQEAEEIYNEVASYLKEFTVKMEAAHKAIDKAKQDMVRASIEKERSQLKSDAAEIKAGLSSDKNDLNVVLNSFQSKANKDRNEAAAANLRVESLTKSDIEKEDENISAALKEASGENEKPKDVSSRLAALKG
jgi:chromosome segregation ATPase